MVAIQGLGQYGGFYNNYRVDSIPTVTVDDVKRQDEQALEADNNQQSHQNNSTSSNPAVIEDNRSRIANLENVSLTFNSGDTFDYIGSDSEIGNLDVQKAVSDMKKDQILEQYQYFYGSSDNSTNQSEDGFVMQKMYL